MIEGTQSPTNMPSSFCPLNQREMERIKEMKAAIKKILSDFFMAQNMKK